MSWLAVLLIGVGVTDLVHSVRPMRHVPQIVGACVAVLAGLSAALTGPRDLLALGVIVVAVLAWGHTVTRGFAGRRPWLPLTVLGGAVVLAIGLGGLAGEVDGLFGRWVETADLPALTTFDPTRALLLLGVLLLQLSTGNVIVRLVLTVTGTVNPARHGEPDDPELQLKGGRLLGPMERLVIVGLGIAGHLTAAAIVIAAKGLLRFPELSSDQGQRRIHQLTEYFLVGSFVSWLVALAAIVLVGA